MLKACFFSFSFCAFDLFFASDITLEDPAAVSVCASLFQIFCFFDRSHFPGSFASAYNDICCKVRPFLRFMINFLISPSMTVMLLGFQSAKLQNRPSTLLFCDFVASNVFCFRCSRFDEEERAPKRRRVEVVIDGYPVHSTKPLTVPKEFNLLTEQRARAKHGTPRPHVMRSAPKKVCVFLCAVLSSNFQP